MAVCIVPVSAAIAHLPTLARWHHAEWASLFPGWSEADARAELEAHARGLQAIPMTLVMLADDHDAEPLGSVSLLDADSAELADLEGPWLASLYVRPDARDNGCGEALVRAAVAHAAVAGIPRLRLFTPAHRGFYARLGWAWEAPRHVAGAAVDVMRIDLAVPA